MSSTSRPLAKKSSDVETRIMCLATGCKHVSFSLEEHARHLSEVAHPDEGETYL